MNILEFGKTMSEEVRDVLGSDYNVNFKEIVKNNGTVYHALIIKRDSANIAPTIYIDGFFENYKNGKVIMSIVNNIVEIYRQHEPGEGFDVDFFGDFALVAPKLTFKLVNYEKNSKMLKDIPYRRFEDLALVPICRVDSKIMGNGAITIKNEHLKGWEIGEEELWENVHRYEKINSPAEIKNIVDCLPKAEEFSAADELLQIYVLSNKSFLYGAGVFLYDGVLKGLANKLGDSLVIIPSSVHEVIAAPLNGNIPDAKALFAMVKDVNGKIMSAEDILSDNVYFYDKETDKIGILV